MDTAGIPKRERFREREKVWGEGLLRQATTNVVAGQRANVPVGK